MPRGNTALMQVVEMRHYDISKMLLHRGASTEAADDRDFSAAHKAASAGQHEILGLVQRAGVAVEKFCGVRRHYTLPQTLAARFQWRYC